MPPIKVFNQRDSEVPEGTNHEYSCTLVDQDASIQLAAITAVRAWLEDVKTGTAILDNIDVFNTGGGSLSDAGGGVGKFTLALPHTAAVVVTAAESLEEHRLTLKFTYNRVGGGAGQIMHEVRYFVRNLAH